MTEPQTVANLFDVAEGTGELVKTETRYAGWGFFFRNGWAVSVLCGPNHFASNRHAWVGVSWEEEVADVRPPYRKRDQWLRSPDAEVAVIRPDGELMTWGDSEHGEPCLGNQPVESVAALIRMVATEGLR